MIGQSSILQQLNSYRQRGFQLIPLRSQAKVPLVRWKEYRLSNDDLLRFASQDANWAIRCDEDFHALDFDDPATYERFVRENGDYFRRAPVVKTGRGYHVWFKPKHPIPSFSQDGVEIKGLGSLIAIPPSIHPNGAEYTFVVPPNGKLPEVDLESLFEIHATSKHSTDDNGYLEDAPSEFALRYGKSPYPQSLCGRATKVFTKKGEDVKHLVSLRCWKWHCPRCARLLTHHWLSKLREVSFRFIVKLPTSSKPTALLRHLDKPNYVHIVSNGQSWLFLTEGEPDKVRQEVEKAGGELVASSPVREQSLSFLWQALCREKEPLRTRRKITQSRMLLKDKDRREGKEKASTVPEQANSDESIRKTEVEEEDMSTPKDDEQKGWDSEVVMKPIDQVARELEAQGWEITWKSEVEAVAVKRKGPTKHAEHSRPADILDLMEELGIELRKTGDEYIGLCPFHDDRNPSLSVNVEKGVWHCFGCGRGGNHQGFLKEWQARNRKIGGDPMPSIR